LGGLDQAHVEVVKSLLKKATLPNGATREVVITVRDEAGSPVLKAQLRLSLELLLTETPPSE
jgi:hypothetical protein